MVAVLLAIFLFIGWTVVGLAALVALRTDVSQLRIALTAPAFGTAVTLVPLFIVSNAGVPMRTGARPIVFVLLATAVGVLAWRRPHLPLAITPVLILCLVDLAFVGRPMFTFGLAWIANANGDMAYYVLSATQLLGNGLGAAVDHQSLASHRDFATSAQALQLTGLRPGAQLNLAGVSAVLGRSPLVLFMPTIFALNMVGICAVGSLALQASRRWWAASVAAALLVASPMAGYGVLQQLMPQIWGLALAVALLSWLMRPAVHQRPGPQPAELAVISILAAAFFLVYVELAIPITAAYGVYVAFLIATRHVSMRALAILWAAPLAAVAIVVNTFLSRELNYVRAAVQFGVGSSHDDVRLFGYALVPSALPGATGLQELFARPTSPHMEISIVVAIGLFLGVLVICVIAASKGGAAATVLVTDLVIGVLLARNSNAFGLFKMYMYIQPFIAAALGAWIANLKGRVVLVVASMVLVAVVGIQISTLSTYIQRSRDPSDLRHASEQDLIPTFNRFVSAASNPVVSVTDNLVLAQLQGASSGDKPLYFIGRNVFGLPWTDSSFTVASSEGNTKAIFGHDPDVSRLVSTGRCTLSLPTGTQVVLNRRMLPEGSPDLALLPCSTTTNALAFVVSTIGEPATLPVNLEAVSFWQLEDDPAFPGHTFAGFGRYALFQIFGSTPTVRVVLSLSTSSLQRPDETFELPPAVMAGAEHVSFPIVGSGSARVISPPLQPKVIDGQPYVLLDMGENGELPVVPRPGLTGLWSKSVALDPRTLTSYVRDVSLVSEAEYRRIRTPVAIREIPADLANPNLEYSGIFEDGWIGRDAYVRLAGGPVARLVVRASVLPRDGGQQLRVVVNGEVISSRTVMPGLMRLNLPLRASRARRDVHLEWAGTTPLEAPDRRSAAAHLEFLGITEAQ